MDLLQFGQQLQTLRKQARLSQEGLVEALDQWARPGPAEEYRAIDGTLISRWEHARTQAGRQWKPTRPYLLHLIRIFAQHLTLATAQQWAVQAGYQITTGELADLFPSETPAAPVTPISAHRMPDSPPSRHNLPAVLTSFVGREAEISLLIESLLTSTTRLLTLVGEGGIGKTRLAVAAAQTIYESQSANQIVEPTSHPKSKLAPVGPPRKFPDGVWFVPLAALEGGTNVNLANLLATAIAKALTFSFPSATLEPAAQLVHHLRAKALLLILDNVEHLVAGATFVVELLQQAEQISILVTSRTPLNCQAEKLFWLRGCQSWRPIVYTLRAFSCSTNALANNCQTLPSMTKVCKR